MNSSWLHKLVTSQSIPLTGCIRLVIFPVLVSLIQPGLLPCCHNVSVPPIRSTSLVLPSLKGSRTSCTKSNLKTVTVRTLGLELSHMSHPLVTNANYKDMWHATAPRIRTLPFNPTTPAHPPQTTTTMMTKSSSPVPMPPHVPPELTCTQQIQVIEEDGH